MSYSLCCWRAVVLADTDNDFAFVSHVTSFKLTLLFFTGPILTLDGNYMKLMESYMFWYRVTKINRRPIVVMYELKVLKEMPPLVDIE